MANEEKNIVIKISGKEQTLRFIKTFYFIGGTLAIMIDSKEGSGWGAWCGLTINLGVDTLKENQAFLDTNNCSKEIIEWLFSNGHAKKIGEKQGVYYTYPLVEFSKEFMELLMESER